MFPPEIPLMLALQVLYGLGYNVAVPQLQKTRLWHVSTSVVVGVAGTLLLEAAFMWQYSLPYWASALINFGCFAASGLPMVLGSLHRTAIAHQAKKSHKPHEWPTRAAHARETVITEMTLLAREIAAWAESGQLNAGKIPGIVNQLHEWIGILKGA